jgi:hypothetical protein
MLGRVLDVNEDGAINSLVEFQKCLHESAQLVTKEQCIKIHGRTVVFSSFYFFRQTCFEEVTTVNLLSSGNEMNKSKQRKTLHVRVCAIIRL